MRWILFLGFLVLTVIVRNAPEVAGPITVPFRLVRLQAQPPEQRLTLPVQGVKATRIANTWQAPRAPGRRHEGQDIFARKGTPIISASQGIVIRKGDGGLGGISVSVFGRGGRVYYYAHLDRWAETLNVGDEVYPGTLLGYVGNTGNARTTPPHLHFGVYTASGAIDPLPLFTS